VPDVQGLRREVDQLRSQKRLEFTDLDRMIKRVVESYPQLFPRYDRREKGIRFAYHFNVPHVYPIVREKEHKGRDCVPPRFAKRALLGIDNLLTYVESQI
jgi:hypothetical protein